MHDDGNILHSLVLFKEAAHCRKSILAVQSDGAVEKILKNESASRCIGSCCLAYPQVLEISGAKINRRNLRLGLHTGLDEPHGKTRC